MKKLGMMTHLWWTPTSQRYRQELPTVTPNYVGWYWGSAPHSNQVKWQILKSLNTTRPWAKLYNSRWRKYQSHEAIHFPSSHRPLEQESSMKTHFPYQLMERHSPTQRNRNWKICSVKTRSRRSGLNSWRNNSNAQERMIQEDPERSKIDHLKC